jgi:hypothetical protein
VKLQTSHTTTLIIPTRNDATTRDGNDGLKLGLIGNCCERHCEICELDDK